ncbi:MAG: gliding motility-associated C-terminal domain-containing protein, partial [Bacteroidia bacterium]
IRDTVSCTTGAEPKDPAFDQLGNSNYPDYAKSSVAYPMPSNYSNDVLARRNLWYTFTASGTGSITVWAQISDQMLAVPFHIYKSNKNGAIPFNVLRTTGRVDSTLSQGLTFIQNNYDNVNNKLYSSISFNKDGCDSSRYYILTETPDYYTNSTALYRNYPVVVSVRYNGTLYANAGDFCTNAIPMWLNGVGTTNAIAMVNCHTIGESFGEDGSNMGCLFDNKNYKSSWFKLTMTASQKVDLTFSIQNGTTALPQNIRYRVLYGDCNAMTPGPCVENALSSFRLDCMAPGEYYVQVVTPNNATGNITVNATTTVSVYPICKPFLLFSPLANFGAYRNCNDTVITFQNFSSAGIDITYKWDFGNGNTSTDKIPTTIFHHKNAIDTFGVKLIVTDTLHQELDSLILPVYIFNHPLFVNAGNDAMISCNGSVQLNATTNYPSPTYLWSPPNYLSNIYIPNPFANPNVSIKYQITMNGNDDCYLEDSMNIFFRNSIKILGDTVLCGNEKKILSGPVGYSNYLWSTNQTTQTIQVDTAGVYFLYASGGACTGYDTITVHGYPSLMISPISDSVMCSGDTISVKVGNGYMKYVWSTNDTTNEIKITNAGTYWIRVSNNICSAADTFSVNFFTSFPIKFPSDTSFCGGGSFILNASTANYTKYLWSTGANTPSIIVSTSGKYSVIVTDTNGCSVYDTIKVGIFNSPPLKLMNDTFICNGSNLILDAKDSAYSKYIWNTGETTPQIKITQPGKYIVTATNGICTTSDSTNVKVTSLPSLRLPPDTVICFDDIEKVILDAGKFKSYFWYPTGETTETIGATVARQYVVVVTDTNNCINKDTTLVEEKCGSKIYIPNAFTPNGDGINDVFYVHSRSLETFEIQIYDRWGEKIFSSTDITKGWDGTFQNLPCMNETYVWLIKYKIKGTNNTQSANGMVMLLR